MGRTAKQVTGFRGRSGRSFRAKLKLEQDDEGKWRVDFDEEWATGARPPAARGRVRGGEGRGGGHGGGRRRRPKEKKAEPEETPSASPAGARRGARSSRSRSTLTGSGGPESRT